VHALGRRACIVPGSGAGTRACQSAHGSRSELARECSVISSGKRSRSSSASCGLGSALAPGPRRSPSGSVGVSGRWACTSVTGSAPTSSRSRWRDHVNESALAAVRSVSARERRSAARPAGSDAPPSSPPRYTSSIRSPSACAGPDRAPAGAESTSAPAGTAARAARLAVVVLDVAPHEFKQTYKPAQTHTSVIRVVWRGRGSGAGADSRNCGGFTRSLALDANLGGRAYRFTLVGRSSGASARRTSGTTAPCEPSRRAFAMVARRCDSSSARV
jgi:hypothetical protein